MSGPTIAEKGEKKRPVRVQSIKDAERLLARVLLQLQKGEISESKARTMAYVANSYAKMFEVSEIEKRVEILESLISGGQGEGGVNAIKIPRASEEG